MKSKQLEREFLRARIGFDRDNKTTITRKQANQTNQYLIIAWISISVPIHSVLFSYATTNNHKKPNHCSLPIRSDSIRTDPIRAAQLRFSLIAIASWRIGSGAVISKSFGDFARCFGINNNKEIIERANCNGKYWQCFLAANSRNIRESITNRKSIKVTLIKNELFQRINFSPKTSKSIANFLYKTILQHL